MLSFQDYFQATLQTLYMTTVALVISVVVGILIGILLVVTRKDSLMSAPRFNYIFNFIINIIRSIPFIILLILLIPLTRLIVGTSIGTTAAIIPLVFYSVPYMARLVEGAILEVDQGVYELAKSYGASNFDTVFKFILPECLPGIVLNITTLTIGLVGASAMAGTIGGGGIGDLAIVYGYGRFQTDVTIICVIILVVIIQAVQFMGIKINNKIKH